MKDMVMITSSRGIEDVTRDIRVQTGQFLRTAIEIGRLLYEAKGMVEPGKWGQYIEQELPFSHSWANNYMKLYKEYGSDQMSLFGDCAAVMKLRPTQALELLALNPEHREKFMEENQVEEMSARELHRAVRQELEQVQAALRDAQQDKLVLEMEAAQLRSTQDTWEEQITVLREKSEAAKKEQESLEKRLEEMRRKAEQAEERAEESRKRLEAMKKNPQIPEKVMQEMQQRFTAEADRKAAEAMGRERDRLEEALKKAEQARAAAESTLAQMKKQTPLSDPDAAVFKVCFTQVQEDFGRMKEAFSRVKEKDPVLAGKLGAAVAALLDKLKEEL